MSRLKLPDTYCDVSLAAAFEGAEAVACRQFCRAASQLYPTVRWLDGAGGVANFYAPSDPINGVKGAGMCGPVDPGEWAAIEALYLDARSPVVVDLCPMADAAFFASLLAAGYTIAGIETVTFRRVGDSPGTPSAAPAHISVVAPSDATAVNAWESTLNAGFANGGAPIQFAVDFGRVRAHTVLSGINPHSFMFLATVDGRPAGGAALTFARATPTRLLPDPPLIALMSGAAVLPSFRRRGIQSALTAARLDLARKHRCDYATLVVNAGSSSHRNACRAGFAVAYSRPQLVLAPPSPAAPR